MDDRRLRAWQALDIGPAWIARGDALEAEHSPEVGSIASMAWPALEQAVASCTRCGLCATRTRTVFGNGSRSARWMLVGEAPGAEEDASGEPFVGAAGRLLDQMLAAIGVDRAGDAFIANTVKCRPPGNRDPLPGELAECDAYLARQIALIRPRLIVALGRVSAQALLRTDAPLAALRGKVHRHRGDGFEVPLVVTYHPAYLLRTPADKSRAWADLCLARAAWTDGAG
jgi:uracil-DNA glycosylase